jgi:8-oxo-dGTP diphosphatase
MNTVRVASGLVALHLMEGRLFVVLSSEPNQRDWRLPQTYLLPNYTSLQSLYVETLKTTGIHLGRDANYLEQLYTTEDVSSGHNTVCVYYIALFRAMKWYKGSLHTGLFPVDDLPSSLSLAEKNSIAYAVERIRAKALYSSILSYLIPKQFSLTELQSAHDGILGTTNDRRNFRKKILGLHVLKELPRRDTLKTTPTLYRFADDSLLIYTKPFTQPEEVPKTALQK